MARLWWQDIWQSPVATEYLRAHHVILIMLAEHIDDWWRTPRADTKKRLALSVEIRLALARYGLDPMAMRSLQWAVDKGEEANERTAQRQRVRTATKAREAADDPRSLLKAVSG